LSLLTTLSAWANSYPRIEAAFDISALATDPFDYAVTDVQVNFQLPEGATLSLSAMKVRRR
jgi:hypothetical protein